MKKSIKTLLIGSLTMVSVVLLTLCFNWGFGATNYSTKANYHTAFALEGASSATESVLFSNLGYAYSTDGKYLLLVTAFKLDEKMQERTDLCIGYKVNGKELFLTYGENTPGTTYFTGITYNNASGGKTTKTVAELFGDKYIDYKLNIYEMSAESADFSLEDPSVTVTAFVKGGETYYNATETRTKADYKCIFAADDAQTFCTPTGSEKGITKNSYRVTVGNRTINGQKWLLGGAPTLKQTIYSEYEQDVVLSVSLSPRTTDTVYFWDWLGVSVNGEKLTAGSENTYNVGFVGSEHGNVPALVKVATITLKKGVNTVILTNAKETGIVNVYYLEYDYKGVAPLKVFSKEDSNEELLQAEADSVVNSAKAANNGEFPGAGKDGSLASYADQQTVRFAGGTLSLEFTVNSTEAKTVMLNITTAGRNKTCVGAAILDIVDVYIDNGDGYVQVKAETEYTDIIVVNEKYDSKTNEKWALTDFGHSNVCVFTLRAGENKIKIVGKARIHHNLDYISILEIGGSDK